MRVMMYQVVLPGCCMMQYVDILHISVLLLPVFLFKVHPGATLFLLQRLNVGMCLCVRHRCLHGCVSCCYQLFVYDAAINMECTEDRVCVRVCVCIVCGSLLPPDGHSPQLQLHHEDEGI